MDKRTTTIVEEPPMSENTPGVVAYRVGQLEEAVKAGFKEHNEKLDRFTDSFATKKDLSNVVGRLKDLESDRKWLFRLVAGTVVVAALSLAFNFKQ
jgi:hypothetical protein